MRRPTRRDLLVALGAGGLGTAGGCTTDSDTGETASDESGTATTTAGTQTRTTTETPAVPRPVRTPDSDPAEMVRIDGGTYTIGTDDGPEDARPAHDVAVESFRIDKYEVTNGEFVDYVNALGFEPLADAPPGSVTREDLRPDAAVHLLEDFMSLDHQGKLVVALDDPQSRIGITDGAFVVEDGYGDHPVNEVTWEGARQFARWRGARLPTEAEWEIAARGREGRPYPWGEAPPTHERAVYQQGTNNTAPVGSHPAGATPTGIHDMIGNVSEWTSSLYRPYPYDADDGREDPTVDGERVTRGGAHVYYDPQELLAYYRTGFSRDPESGHRHIGFRCARSVT